MFGAPSFLPPLQPMVPARVTPAKRAAVDDPTRVPFCQITNASNQQPKQQPVLERISSCFNVSPEGIGCRRCVEEELSQHPVPINLNSNAVLRHLKKHNLNGNNGIRKSAADEYVYVTGRQLRRIPRRMIEENLIGEVCMCGTIFNDRSNARRHCQNRNNPCHVAGLKPRNDICRLSCGRLTLPEKAYHDGMEVRDLAYIHMSVAPFVRPDEGVDTYIKMFSKLFGRGSFKLDFDRSIRDAVKKIQDRDDERLQEIYRSMEAWLERAAAMEVYEVEGNYRAMLQVFQGFDMDETKHQYTYTFRHKVDTMKREMKPLIAYAFNCGKFDSFNPADPYSVPNILVDLLLEKPGRDEHSLVAEFCCYQGFRVGKEGDISMISCGTQGSSISAIMSGLRAAACSLISNFNADRYERADELCRKINQCPVMSTLAPFVRWMREMQNAKPKTKRGSLDEFGNISVDHFDFPLEIWSQLLPHSIKALTFVLKKMVVPSSWKALENFLDTSIAVDVTISDDDRDLLLREVQQVKFRDGIPRDVVDQLQAHLLLAFHGYGGGGMRFSELQEGNLSMGHCTWHQRTVYYSATPIKSFSTWTPGREEVWRKLPRSIARFFLIYRHFLRSTDAPRRKPVMFRDGANYGPSSVIRDFFSFDETPSMTVVRHLWAMIANVRFGSQVWDKLLEDEVDPVAASKMGHSHVTHAGSYSANILGREEYLFANYHLALGGLPEEPMPKKSDLSVPELMTGLEQMYGHGAAFRSNAQKDLVRFASTSNRIHCLADLPCGMGKSLAWTLPLIAGRLAGKERKSTMVILPYRLLAAFHFRTLQAKLKELAIGIEVAFFEKIEQGRLPESLADVGGRGAKLLPSITFFSLDAVRCLVQYHSLQIRNWVKAGLLGQWIIDEVHTYQAEEAFRISYDKGLAKLSQFKVPVIAMSGTLPNFLFGPTARKLGLTVSADDSKLGVFTIRCHDLVGSFPSGFKIDAQQVPSVSDSTFKAASRHLFRHPNDSVHIFVSTRDEADSLAKRFKDAKMDADVVRRGLPIDQVLEVGERWRAGKLRILVTTSCGLVGIESPSCSMLIVHGYLYSLLQVVQAIGRLRPSHRKPYGRIAFFVPEVSPGLVQRKQADEINFQRQVATGWCDEDDDDSFNLACTTDAVVQFLEDNTQCRVVSLSKRFGRESPGECGGVCDVCRKTAKRIVTQQKISKAQQRHRDNVNDTLKLIERLRVHQLCCRMPICVGTRHSKHDSSCSEKGKCWYCCEYGHPANLCKEKPNLKQLLTGKACVECLLWKEYGCYHDSHDNPICMEAKHRLERLVQIDYFSRPKPRSMSYRQFFIGIFASEENYFAWGAKMAAKYNLVPPRG